MEFGSDSSDPESQSVENVRNVNDDLSSSEEDDLVISCQFTPYQDEPLADEMQNNEEDDERDMDGLTPNVLADRQDGTIPVDA